MPVPQSNDSTEAKSKHRHSAALAAAAPTTDETSPLIIHNGKPSLLSSDETSSLLESSSSSSSSGNSTGNDIHHVPHDEHVTSGDLEAVADGQGKRQQQQNKKRKDRRGSFPGQVASTRAILKVVLVLLIGVFTSNADGSLVLATHPVIASEFNVLGDSSWLFISFALAGACTQTLYAKLSDIYGRKTLLLWSYALFAAGCALVGLGKTYWQVILGRVISGSGGSGMTTLVAVLITDLVPLREVAPWQSYLNVVATIGRSLGGPLGGWLADTIGWRWSFLGQAPLFILALILCWIILPDTRASSSRAVPTSRENGPDEEQESSNRFAQIDFLGAALLGLAILTLMLPLEIGGTKIPWTHPLIFVLFGAGSILLALFLATEAWWAKEPIFPLVLLRQRDVIASYAIMGCQLAAQIGLMFSVPLYFQVTARVSNTIAGAHLFPAVAGNAVGGMMSGWLIHRTGRYKGLIILGTLASSSSYLLLMLTWHGHTNWLESMYIIPGGFGTGIAQSAVFISLQAAIDREHRAAATSGLFLTWPIGMTIGLATISAVMLGGLRTSLDDRLVQLHFTFAQRQEIIKNAVSNVDYLDKISGRVLQAVVAAYVDGLWWSHGVSLIFALLGFVGALFLRQHKL